MKALPAWILALMVGLTTLLTWIGWHDRHEAGYLPFALGIVFAVVTLASIANRLKPARD